MNDLTLQVEGMSCAVCVGKVQPTLEELPFVCNPSVNLATENARVTLDDAADVARVAAALARSGYPGVTDRLGLSVEGQADAVAVARAEALLATLARVIDAKVNLATETATVTIAAGALPVSRLTEVLTGARFGATVRTGTGHAQAARRAAEIRRLGWLTVIAAALALPVFMMEVGGTFARRFTAGSCLLCYTRR